MSVETFTPQNELVSLTDSAIRYFEGKLQQEPGKLIRLGTKVNGCTGYAYTLDYVEAAGEGDKIIEISPELTLAVAGDAVNIIQNTEIDYVREGVNGIVKFNNPNVAEECGCGESFSVNS